MSARQFHHAGSPHAVKHRKSIILGFRVDDEQWDAVHQILSEREIGFGEWFREVLAREAENNPDITNPPGVEAA